MDAEQESMTLLLRCALAGPLIVGVAACGSGLTRSQAASAISTRINGPVSAIRIFRERCVEENFGNYPPRFLEDAQTFRQYRSLHDAGLATTFYGQPTPEKCGTPYLEHKQLIAITLTAKGAAEKWPEHTERGGGWDIVPANRELLEVTDIVTESDLARAAFTWQLIPTAGGAALGHTSSPQAGSATFRQEAGQWRLIRIDNRPPGLREPLSESPGRRFR
jgi:hypothetical protein